MSAPAPPGPVISPLRDEAGVLRASLRFPAAWPVFRGHFPGHPIVPGAELLRATAELLEAHTRRRLVAIDRLVFRAPAGPDQPLRLTATRTPDGFAITLHHADRPGDPPVCEGRLRLAP